MYLNVATAAVSVFWSLPRASLPATAAHATLDVSGYGK